MFICCGKYIIMVVLKFGYVNSVLLRIIYTDLVICCPEIIWIHIAVVLL